MAARDEIHMLLQHEIEGLRVQMASKEEVLERCLEELDRFQAIIQTQEEDMKRKDQKIESLEAQIAGLSRSEAKEKSWTKKKSSHGYIPGRNSKAELAPSCKITMAAKASHK